MHDNLKEKLRGINAINVTPFTEDGQIEWEQLKMNIHFLINSGIEVIYPCGNTGEFYSLTLDESMEVTRKVIEYSDGNAAVLAGVGYDMNTAKTLAKNAMEAGADGILIHQPMHPYLLASGLVEYYTQIANSTTLPVIIYVRNESITPETLKEVAKIPNIIGIKYAVNNLLRFARSVDTVTNDLVWICGSAELWAPFFFAAGAEGFTSGMVNVAPDLSQKLLRALKEKRNSEAMEFWNKIRPFEELRARHGNGNNVSVVKEAMSQLGLVNAYVRPPIFTISDSEKAEVTDVLKNWRLI